VYNIYIPGYYTDLRVCENVKTSQKESGEKNTRKKIQQKSTAQKAECVVFFLLLYIDDDAIVRKCFLNLFYYYC
jgi:hypothetical protein